MKADESQKIMSLVKYRLTQWEIEEENRIKDQLMKNLQNLIEKVWEENRKIIKYKYCRWKNLLT